MPHAKGRHEGQEMSRLEQGALAALPWAEQRAPF